MLLGPLVAWTASDLASVAWNVICFRTGVKITARTLLGGAAASICIPVAQAHPGHDGHDVTWNFQTGFAHPFSGWDHLVAMIAVGWWAMQIGGRARWLVPAAFLGVFAASAALGHWIVRPSGMEQGIAASLLVVGLMVARAERIPAAVAVALVGAFAFFHGLAHGAEAPLGGIVSYGSGIVSATAVLLSIGLAAGALSARAHPAIARTAGLACAAIGLVALFR